MPGRKRTTTRKPAARKLPAPIKRGPGEASLSLTIDGDLYVELQEIARRQERSLAGLVRYALREHVAEEKIRQALRDERAGVPDGSSS